MKMGGKFEKSITFVMGYIQLCVFYLMIQLVTSQEPTAVITFNPTTPKIHTGASRDRKVADVSGYIRAAPDNSYPQTKITDFSLDTQSSDESKLFKIVNRPDIITIRTDSLIDKQPGDYYVVTMIYSVTIPQYGRYTTRIVITINVTHRNIYTPQFSESRYTFYASPNGQGSYMGTIYATDTDAVAENRQIRFELNEHSNINDKNIYDISLKNEDGRKADVYLEYVNSPFKHYARTVNVYDGGTPEKEGVATVVVMYSTLPIITTFCSRRLSDHLRVCWKVDDRKMDANIMPMFWLSITRVENRPGFHWSRSWGVSGYDRVQKEVCKSVNLTELRREDNYVAHMWIEVQDNNQKSQMSQGFNFNIRQGASSVKDCDCRRCPSYPCNPTKLQTKGYPSFQCSQISLCNLLQPCHNGATCHLKNRFTTECICPTGWTGEFCDVRDLCVDGPCQNGAQCSVDGRGGLVCACPAGYVGTRCEYWNQCNDNPCQNAGLCTADSVGNATCRCRYMYNGDFCQYYDACMSTPCGNHANCTRYAQRDYICACPDGFYGKDCNEMDLCDLVPDYCLHRGLCQVLTNRTARCLCEAGWQGNRCQDYDYCVQNICEHNGTCSYLGHLRFKCACTGEFYGDRCEFYNKCLDKPCGDNGLCKNKSNTYTCDCSNGHYGHNCEFYNKCFVNPCKRGGICASIKHNEYECACTETGTYGKNCEFMNTCELKPCKNGATCINTSKYDDYRCVCKPGWTGILCESYNHCDVGVCQNNGICTYVGHNKYSCKCSDGFYGNDCESYNQCLDKPCQNYGQCSNTSDSFTCECSRGYYGDRCEYYNACVTKPCAEHGVCINGTGREFTCKCTDVGYYGKYCVSYNACIKKPCENGALCTNTTDVGNYKCYCDKSLYGGWNCQYFRHCPESNTTNEFGNFTWPLTVVGEVSLIACELGPEDVYVERKCLDGQSARWDDPMDKGCMSAGELTALEALNGLKNLTSDPSSVTAAQLGEVADTLNGVVEFTLKKVAIATVMTDVVSNVMSVDGETLREGQAQGGANDKMKSVLDKYTADAVIPEGSSNVTIVSGDLNVVAMDIKKGHVGAGDQSLTLKGQFGESSGEPSPSISIPADILASLTANSTSARLQLLAYGNSKLFVDSSSTNESTANNVLSLSVKGMSLNLTNETAVSFVVPRTGDDPAKGFTCVYWDEKEERWSTEGVSTVMTEDNETICESTHLTSFSILMDPDPGTTLPVIHQQIQTYITYIGCAISILALFFTLVTFILFKCLHGDRTGKILINICASMLFLNIVFVFGSLDASFYGEQLCMAVAIGLHYFLLTTCVWMLIEALNMYEVLIVVFTEYAHWFMLKRLIVGWGTPLVVVAITMGVSLDNYRTNDEFCFISHASPIAFYAAVLAPACLILLINAVVFVRVVMVIMKRPKVGSRDDKNDDGVKITATQVRGGIAVMVVLGITWVLGPLAIGPAKVFFTYAFTILNSIQGFLLFLFRCAMNIEARMAWRQLLTTGTLKKRRGVVVSTTVTSVSEVRGSGAKRANDKTLSTTTTTTVSDKDALEKRKSGDGGSGSGKSDRSKGGGDNGGKTDADVKKTDIDTTDSDKTEADVNDGNIRLVDSGQVVVEIREKNATENDTSTDDRGLGDGSDVQEHQYSQLKYVDEKSSGSFGEANDEITTANEGYVNMGQSETLERESVAVTSSTML